VNILPLLLLKVNRKCLVIPAGWGPISLFADVCFSEVWQIICSCRNARMVFMPRQSTFVPANALSCIMAVRRLCVCVCVVRIRLGHALLALKMSRSSAVLSAQQVMELGHHILKAHIYKSIGTSASRQQLSGAASSRDLQAYWMCLSTDCLSDALVSHRNLFSPNVKVCYRVR